MKDNNQKIGNSILCEFDLEIQTAIITIDREKQLNALNQEVIISLEQAFDDILKKPSIRSVILTGAGKKAFVAGADIKEFENFNTKQAQNLSERGKKRLFNKLTHFKKPVISAINGYALGGGLELALSCHVRIASLDAKLGLPECTLGLIPGYSGTQKLPQIISKNIAMEMILTGKIIDAKEAYRIGLVNYVVATEDLLHKSKELAKSFKKTSPESLSAAIKSINMCYSNQGEAVESEEFGKLFGTKNFKEGVGAFLEKRKPKFSS